MCFLIMSNFVRFLTFRDYELGVKIYDRMFRNASKISKCPKMDEDGRGVGKDWEYYFEVDASFSRYGKRRYFERLRAEGIRYVIGL